MELIRYYFLLYYTISSDSMKCFNICKSKNKSNYIGVSKRVMASVPKIPVEGINTHIEKYEK